LTIDGRRLEPGQYETVHVVEHDGDRERGGIMFVVTHAKDGRAEQGKDLGQTNDVEQIADREGDESS
jgi:hypothetical protein